VNTTSTSLSHSTSRLLNLLYCVCVWMQLGRMGDVLSRRKVMALRTNASREDHRSVDGRPSVRSTQAHQSGNRLRRERPSTAPSPLADGVEKSTHQRLDGRLCACGRVRQRLLPGRRRMRCNQSAWLNRRPQDDMRQLNLLRSEGQATLG
jgi:hypothetical protein